MRTPAGKGPLPALLQPPTMARFMAGLQKPTSGGALGPGQLCLQDRHPCVAFPLLLLDCRGALGSLLRGDVLQQHGQVWAGHTEPCPRKKSLLSSPHTQAELWEHLQKLSAALWNHSSLFPAFRPWDASAPWFLQAAVQADSVCHVSQESR